MRNYHSIEKYMFRMYLKIKCFLKKILNKSE